MLCSIFFASILAHAVPFIPVDAEHVGGRGLIVTVDHEDAFLPGAMVWIETLDGKLLVKGETDIDGRFVADLDEATINAGTVVTGYIDGFIPVTFTGSTSNRVRLTLPYRPIDDYAIISGTMTGFDPDGGDAYAKLGIVAKALGVADLGRLDASSFISPINDQIPVYGSRDVPSNLIFPDQWFTLGIIPVHINKPRYRVPALAGSNDRYLILSGNAHAGHVLDSLKHNMSEKMLDYLNVTRVGLTEPVKVGFGDKKMPIDLNVKADVLLDSTIELKGNISDLPPDNKGIPGEMKHMIGALWEAFDGVYVPTDVKFLEQDKGATVTLKTPKDRPLRVLDLVVQGDAGTRFRGEWLDPRKGVIPKSTLSASVNVTDCLSTWSIDAAEGYNLMVARMQDDRKTSLNATRIEDRWVIVSPFKKTLTPPTAALAELRSQLGTISAVSVDLIDTRSGGYPHVHGQEAAEQLTVLEKVFRKLH